MITVSKLIEMLEEAQEELGPDASVMVLKWKDMEITPLADRAVTWGINGECNLNILGVDWRDA